MSVSFCFAPMSLAVLDEPFDYDDFILELKYDGLRALAHVDNGPLAPYFPQPPHEFTTFPELCAALGQALPCQLVLDGEIVYLGKDGQGLRGLPLIKRKRLLKKIVKSPVLFVDHLVGRGVDLFLFQAVCQRDWEGILAKAAHGLYQPEKTTWVKIKNPNYSQAAGCRDFFNARVHRNLRHSEKLLSPGENVG